MTYTLIAIGGLLLLYICYLVEKIALQTYRTMEAATEICYQLSELAKIEREHLS